MRIHSVVVAACFALGGCATYTTPGAGVAVGNLSAADQDIAETLSRKPEASFPVRVALARVQAPGYVSGSNSCFGRGRYCVVTARDIESEEDIKRIQSLAGVAGAIPVNRLLLPQELNSIKDLRRAAAKLKADMVLVYSLDTRFSVDSQPLGPLAVVSLGFIKNKNAKVATTASAVIFDVRSEYVYGVAEFTVTENQKATIWSSSSVIESARIKTEQQAVAGLVVEIEKAWKGVMNEHSRAGS